MPGDIFATKGAEYLLTIGYFILLIALVRYLAPRPAARPAPAPGARRAVTPWFSLAEGYHFHKGHSWARPEANSVTVGLDDFTAQLVGRPDILELPAIGTAVKQGERGWKLSAGGRTLAMVSPVEGEVVEINQKVVADPELATQDPYGEGWLLKVKAAQPVVSLRNLLSGELAAAWLRQSVERLRQRPFAELGMLMPDGGAPVKGFGLQLGPAEWDAVARDDYLMD